MTLALEFAQGIAAKASTTSHKLDGVLSWDRAILELLFIPWNSEVKIQEILEELSQGYSLSVMRNLFLSS